MPRTKPHGYKRKHLFKVGDLVRWNRWHLCDDWTEVDGRKIFKKKIEYRKKSCLKHDFFVFKENIN